MSRYNETGKSASRSKSPLERSKSPLNRTGSRQMGRTLNQDLTVQGRSPLSRNSRQSRGSRDSMELTKSISRSSISKVYQSGANSMKSPSSRMANRLPTATNKSKLPSSKYSSTKANPDARSLNYVSNFGSTFRRNLASQKDQEQLSTRSPLRSKQKTPTRSKNTSMDKTPKSQARSKSRTNNRSMDNTPKSKSRSRSRTKSQQRAQIQDKGLGSIDTQ